jgi:cytochrome c553
MMSTTTTPRKADKGIAAKPRSRAKRVFAWTGGLLLVAAVVAGAIYGPELVGLYQVGKQIDTIAADSARTGGPWPRATDACVYCHGYDGNARAQTYPRLAGQPKAYLKRQLEGFAAGTRSDPTMTPLALGMSEKEIDAFAAHFSGMAPQPNATFHADKARAARGEALVASASCTACHGQKLEGNNEFPRLAGQGYDYVRDQLMRFKDGTRRDPTGVMTGVAGQLTQQNIEDLAQYIASR